MEQGRASSKVGSWVGLVRRFQTIALVTTGAAIMYYYVRESNKSTPAQDVQQMSSASEAMGKEGQSLLARALDTDCEHCLEIRRKLFGTTFIPEKDRKAEQAASHE